MEKFLDIYPKNYYIIIKIPIKPISEEERRLDEEFIKEQKEIDRYKKQYNDQTLGFIRRDGKIILVAHGYTDEEVSKTMLESAGKGIFDIEKEPIIYD